MHTASSRTPSAYEIDCKIRDRLAFEIMGWKRWRPEDAVWEGHYDGDGASWGERWEPFENWNHTMQVVEKSGISVYIKPGANLKDAMRAICMDALASKGSTMDYDSWRDIEDSRREREMVRQENEQLDRIAENGF